MSAFSPPAAPPGLARPDHLSGDSAAALGACDAILERAEREGFSGHDPYDGLAATRLMVRPLKWSRWGRLALIQAVRRSSADLRPALGIPPLVNPKALALLMDACCNLFRATGQPQYRSRYELMARRVLELSSPGWSGLCWGYPFPWQARAFYFPAWTPTSVCTAFVARAFINGHRTWGDAQALDAARSAGKFLARDLNLVETRYGPAFSYSPLDHTVVHNAYALVALVLARVGAMDGADPPLETARVLYATLMAAQNKDGSWRYGLAAHHDWIDNLHTGYVLECLRQGAPLVGLEAGAALEQGQAFFNAHCLSDGLPVERVGGRPGHFEMHTAAETLRCLLQEQPRRESCAPLLRVLLAGIDARGATSDEWSHDRWRSRVPGGFARWSRAWAANALAFRLTAGDAGLS